MKNLIPKTIHYCWFGHGYKPKLVHKCIDSWKKHCKDYEIIEWNESSFNVNDSIYTAEAYKSKKYAFVSDYVRLYVMYNYGGIYLDTDVEIVRPLDVFLAQKAFSGFENEHWISTGIMASEKGIPIIKEFLEYYTNRHFIKPDGSLDLRTNVKIITEISEAHGFIANNKYQVIHDFTIYPRDYFCPIDDSTGKKHVSENTAAIHWFTKSWMDPKIVYRSKITRVFHFVFGVNCFSWIKRIFKI